MKGRRKGKTHDVSHRQDNDREKRNDGEHEAESARAFGASTTTVTMGVMMLKSTLLVAECMVMRRRRRRAEERRRRRRHKTVIGRMILFIIARAEVVVTARVAAVVMTVTGRLHEEVPMSMRETAAEEGAWSFIG